MFRGFDICKLAAQKMIDDNFLIFDTETTGLGEDDEIIELGIIDCSGAVLYDGLFRPEKDVHWAAAKVSGLTNDRLSNEPLFKDEFNKIMQVMNGRPIIAFNEGFDERMFYQTADRYGLDRSLVEQAFSRSFCCQHLYNEYLGYSGHAKLEFACATEEVDAVQNHRATGDCLMTLALLERIADTERTPDLNKYLSLRAEKYGKETSANSQTFSKKHKGVNPDAPSYLSLFNENKTLEEIAAIRGVRLSTVESNIVNLYLRGDIESVDFMIDAKYVADVLKAANAEDWDGRLRTIKEQVPEDCSYACIRAVLAKLQKEKEGFSVSLSEKLIDAQNRYEEMRESASEQDVDFDIIKESISPEMVK